MSDTPIDSSKRTWLIATGCAGAPPSLFDCGSINWDPTTGSEPFRLGGNSGTTSCGDVDNDGDLDLLTSEIAHWWAGQGSDGAELLVNSGDAAITFTRPGRASVCAAGEELSAGDCARSH